MGDVFLKIDQITPNETGYAVTIPKGGLQFIEKGYTKAIGQALILNLTKGYNIMNVSKRIVLDVFEVNSIEVLKSESVTLFELVTIPGVHTEIINQVRNDPNKGV